jgi:UDP-glucuronate 4-epimerase
MKILVTGASGTVGGYLIEDLTKAGHNVVALGRHRPDSLKAPTIFVKGDIRIRDSLARAKTDFGVFDSVVHLAALVPRTKDEDAMVPMIESNVIGTANLLEVFGPDLKNFVYASTAEIYGLPQSGALITEDLTPNPLSFYGATKLSGELICNAFGQKHGLAVSILRFTVLYGPGDRINRAVPNFIRKALSRDTLEVYGGEELRDYLHVTDAAGAAFLAATKGVGGTFNIGTGKGISIKDTATSIAKMVDPDSKVKILPRTKKASDIVLDSTKAKAILGFSPKYVFPELLDEQIAWYKSNQ